jgi:hypothetical protein
MFRNVAFALVTAATLGAAALVPAAASAHPFHHGHWGWGPGIVGSVVVADACVRRQVFHTPYGWRVRWVNVCY